jgi:aminoglycoside phosphotransferase (APT) family kinase protein
MSAQTCASRIARLQKSLAQRLNDPAVVLERYRDGIDSWVDLVRRPGCADAVVRSAKVERRMTRYEGLVDYGEVIEKEIVVSRLLREHNIPTPQVIAWHHSADPESEPSWTLTEFVPHVTVNQLSSECQRDLGKLARRIHSIKPSGDDLKQFPPAENWHEWIRQRILTRIQAAQAYMPIPSREYVDRFIGVALATRPLHPESLLHLDLREPNLAISNDRIIGVFDLANALVGDSYLELGRIRGCGLLTPGFLEGYGETLENLKQHRLALDAYELDLTALLVVVSREETDNIDLHRTMIQRTTALLERLGWEHGTNEPETSR